MSKKKAYEEVSKELENIRKARTKFEKQMREVDEIKGVLIQVGEDMAKIVKMIDSNHFELVEHKKIIIETIGHVQKLEEKGKPSKDMMFG